MTIWGPLTSFVTPGRDTQAMKYLIVLLALVSLAIAQEAPSENPREVWVKGRKMTHSWRDGRIFVPVQEVGPLLNIKSDFPTVDLLQALDEKGGYVYGVVDGRFEAKRDRTLYSNSTNARQARAQNQRFNRAYSKYKADEEQRKATEPVLTHKVQRFVADTGFVRAYVRVTNTGGGPSEPMILVADFTDGYGKAFARDTAAVAPLQPGESRDYEVFSLVDDDEMAVNGVIRTVNSEKVRVTFREGGRP